MAQFAQGFKVSLGRPTICRGAHAVVSDERDPVELMPVWVGPAAMLIGAREFSWQLVIQLLLLEGMEIIPAHPALPPGATLLRFAFYLNNPEEQLREIAIAADTDSNLVEVLEASAFRHRIIREES